MFGLIECARITLLCYLRLRIGFENGVQFWINLVLLSWLVAYIIEVYMGWNVLHIWVLCYFMMPTFIGTSISHLRFFDIDHEWLQNCLLMTNSVTFLTIFTHTSFSDIQVPHILRIISSHLMNGNAKVPYLVGCVKNDTPDPASELVRDFVITLNMLILKLLSIWNERIYL